MVSCTDAADSNAKYMEATDCTGSSPTYTTHVAPILNARCATSGCHTAISPSHGLNLQGYQIVKSTFDQHKLLCSINHGSECNAMPQGAGKLSESDILTITCWAKKWVSAIGCGNWCYSRGGGKVWARQTQFQAPRTMVADVC
jgi:hypothetical protein